MGMTSTTKSPGWMRSPTIFRVFGVCPSCFASSSFSSWMCVPAAALTYRICSREISSGRTGEAMARSILLTAITKGICFWRICCKIRVSSSVMPSCPSMTSSAISVVFKICCVFSIRRVPSSPVSSSPGVSVRTTGPRGRSSIAFLTGSVVVPLKSETMDTGCPARALIRLDFPAFLFPKIPMWIRSAEGVWLSVIKMLLSVRNGNPGDCSVRSGEDSPEPQHALFHLGRFRLLSQ